MINMSMNKNSGGTLEKIVKEWAQSPEKPEEQEWCAKGHVL